MITLLCLLLLPLERHVAARPGEAFYVVVPADGLATWVDYDRAVVRREGKLGDGRFAAVGVGKTTIRGWVARGREMPKEEIQIHIHVTEGTQ